MRYYLDTTTLFVRGAFRAASTGFAGGIRNVTTLFNHTVPADWNHAGPEKEIALVTAAAGTGPDVLGLLTAVPIRHLCVLQYDFVTVFVTAGISQKQSEGPGTINIIAYSSEGMEDSALLETIMVASEAKAEAMLAFGRGSGTPTDAVIAACEGEVKHRYSGRITEPGHRVRDAVPGGCLKPSAVSKAGRHTRSLPFSSTAGSKADTGWSGRRSTAPTIPAISRGSPATSATARSTRARTNHSANGQQAPQTAGSGTVHAVPCCTNRQSRTT